MKYLSLDMAAFREQGPQMPELPRVEKVGHTRYSTTHNREEGSHVLPGRFRPMADNHHAAFAPCEHAPDPRVGPVEPGNGAGPLVRPDGRPSSAGGREAPQGADGPPAAAGRGGRCPPP